MHTKEFFAFKKSHTCYYFFSAIPPLLQPKTFPQLLLSRMFLRFETFSFTIAQQKNRAEHKNYKEKATFRIFIE